MTNSYKVTDSVDAGDFFCGGGGASQGLHKAGVDLRFAANHDAVAIATHTANHPTVDHYHVDLLEYDVAKMPPVRMAQFSPSCKHHSQANANKVYEQPAVLGDDPMDEEARSGYANSERSRVTMSCVLRYAAAHHPETMIVENVVEAAKWGPNRDGTTFQWWLRELDKIGYETKPVMLNSVAFGVPQSRDRMFVICWRKGMRAPNLDHYWSGWCPSCEAHVEAFQWFRKPTAAWPLAEWGKLGKQYDYRCVNCTTVVDIHQMPVASVLDFSDLGNPLMGRDKPLAQSTIDRVVRYLEMHEYQLPFVTLTSRGDQRSPGWPITGPMPTMTTRHEQAIVAACQVTMYGPLGSMFAKQNGQGHDTMYHPTSDPANVITAKDTTALCNGPAGRRITLDDLTLRMLKVEELRDIMAYSPHYKFAAPGGGQPSKRDKIRLLGDGVTPPVLEWATNRCLEIMG